MYEELSLELIQQTLADIEVLAANLSSKIWQKIVILDSAVLAEA